MDTPAPAPAPPGPSRSAHTIIFLIIFLDLLGVGLVAPLTPYVVDRFASGGPFFRTGTAVTLVTLAYSLAQFFATPILGALSDRVGRRPVLLISMVGSAMGYVLFALAGTYWMVILSRLIDGFTGGNIATAQAYIADVTPAKDRAKAFGLTGAAFGLGFTLGPAFGGLLSHIDQTAPIWASAGLALLTATLVYLKLPETVDVDRRRGRALRMGDMNPLGSLARVAAGGVLVLLAAIFMMTFAHAEMRSTFALFLKTRLKLDQHHTEFMFAYVGLMAIVVQGFLVRRVAPWLGDRTTALIGLPIAMAGYAMIPMAHSPWFMCLVITVMALGGGLAGPTITSMLSSSVPPQEYGAAMGASASISALALVVGPLAAGMLYDHVGMGWPFWTGAGFVLLAWLLIALRPHARAVPEALPADAGG